MLINRTRSILSFPSLSTRYSNAYQRRLFRRLFSKTKFPYLVERSYSFGELLLHRHFRFASSRSFSATSRLSSGLSEIPTDRWGGVSVDSSRDLVDVTPDAFEADLRDAVANWTKAGVRVVTMKILESDARLLPVVVASGFTFHHAQPGYAFLKRWMAPEEKDSFPDYANHYLGVAGFVVDNDGNLLVVRERFAARKHWKLPGGAADVGEDLHEVAVREVREETGIECDFVGVVCFRHMHNFRHGCSDFYFVCHLVPRSKEIVVDRVEIEECRWMPLTEYMEKQAPTAMNKYFVQCFLDYVNQDKFKGVIGKKSIHHHINKVDYNVYSMVHK